MLLRWDGYLISERFYHPKKKSLPASHSSPPPAVASRCAELGARGPLRSGFSSHAFHYLTVVLSEFTFRRL